MNRDALNGGGNGWDHDEPGAIVDAAVEAIGAEDPEAGRWADLAANLLTFGQGPQAITQSWLQEFLWYTLPRKSPPEDWLPIVDGTTRLLDQLGLTRYADIARSPTTKAILEAWEDDDGDGFDRFRAAMDASGLAPPDTGLISWGGVMGSEEYTAHEVVALALEAAIVSGELRPGTSGWRARAAAVTDRVMTQQVRPLGSSERSPQRRFDLVLGERVETWISTGHPEPLRERRRIAASRFMDGPVPIAPDLPPTELLETAIAPLAWLLDTCRDGVKATAAGYLPPSLVREAAKRFGWWIFPGQPRTEADVFPLILLHEMATRSRWLQKRSGRIRTSRSALALLDDPPALWRAVVKTIGGQSEFTAMVGELIAIRLLEGPAEHIGPIDEPSELALAVSETMLTQGWQEDGTSITPRDVDFAIHEPLREWRLFGLLDRPTLTREALLSTRPTVALSDIGKIAAVAHLYVRATRARRDIFF